MRASALLLDSLGNVWHIHFYGDMKPKSILQGLYRESIRSGCEGCQSFPTTGTVEQEGDDRGKELGTRRHLKALST